MRGFFIYIFFVSITGFLFYISIKEAIKFYKDFMFWFKIKTDVRDIKKYNRASKIKEKPILTDHDNTWKPIEKRRITCH